MITRRELLKSSGMIVPALAGHAISAAGQNVAVRKQKVTRYELIPTKIPMDERVREAWQRSFVKQGRYQTHYSPTMVRLFTDEGLVGIADAAISAEYAKPLLDSIVGHSPWEFLLDDRLGGTLVAIYDLVGQATGLPVSKLFSPTPRSHIRQAWWSQCFPPELMASEAKRGADLGYRVHKVKARPWEDPIVQAEAICEVIPRDMRVWVDANAWWGSVGRTLFFTKRLEKFHNYFAIESPIRRDRIDGYRQIKGKTALQVSEHMPAEPMPFVREGLVDAFVVGGPIGRKFVQRAFMAETVKIPLWVQHSTSSGVNQVFQAHQAAAFPAIEHAVSITHVLEDDLMLEPFTLKDGFFEVPSKPGLGVSLDMDAIEKYRVA